MAQVGQWFLVTQGTAEPLLWQVQSSVQLKTFQTALAQISNPTVLTDPKTLLRHPAVSVTLRAEGQSSGRGELVG